MKSVFNVASSATRLGAYESPDAQVVLLHPEGVLCSSGDTDQFEERDYSDGSFWN